LNNMGNSNLSKSHRFFRMKKWCGYSDDTLPAEPEIRVSCQPFASSAKGRNSTSLKP